MLQGGEGKGGGQGKCRQEVGRGGSTASWWFSCTSCSGGARAGPELASKGLTGLQGLVGTPYEWRDRLLRCRPVATVEGVAPAPVLMKAIRSPRWPTSSSRSTVTRGAEVEDMVGLQGVGRE